MSHTYACNEVHIVFSTKERRDLLPDGPETWSYFVGIAANHGIRIDAIGGTRNHVHLLLALPPSDSLAHVVNVLKSNTSKWLNQRGNRFAWQEGYGAFSVSSSQIAAVTRYMEHQKQHHAKRSFDEEFIALLKRHGVDYDPRCVFG